MVAHDEFPMPLLFALEHIYYQRNRCNIVPLEWALKERVLFESKG